MFIDEQVFILPLKDGAKHSEVLTDVSNQTGVNYVLHHKGGFLSPNCVSVILDEVVISFKKSNKKRIAL